MEIDKMIGIGDIGQKLISLISNCKKLAARTYWLNGHESVEMKRNAKDFVVNVKL